MTTYRTYGSPKRLLIVPIIIIGFFVFKNYAKKIKDKESFITSISSRLFDFNSFDIEVDQNLDISDFKILNQNSGKVIFSDGESKKGITNNYGFRIFELYKNDQKIFEFGHFSTNNWYTFDYVLRLSLNESDIVPKLKILREQKSAYNNFYSKKFKYDKNGKLDKVIYLTKNNEIYKTEEVD